MSYTATRWVILALAFGLSTANLLADGPVFEVVSIREVPRNAPPVMRDQAFTPFRPGGQFVDPRANLAWMIVFAFHIPSFIQLTGLPDWAKEQSFSVIAKPSEDFPQLPPEENVEQVRAMMREMLATRFHLKLHTESREQKVLKLQVARGGLKIKAVDPPVPPQKEGLPGLAAGNSGGRMIGNKVTMARIAKALTAILHCPVLDETGLSGYYTFDVKWTAAEPVNEAVFTGLGPEGVSAIMTGLNDLLGLRLASGTGTINYWVVDSVERPTPN